MIDLREQLQAFDPGDEFDAMADWFRHQTVNMAIEAAKIAIYRGLPIGKQIECFMAGVLTGYIGVLFAFIAPDSRDPIMESIIEYLPHARLNAEEIIASGQRESER